MKLYNPHGSDVTIFLERLIIAKMKLYNPHGSDVTELYDSKSISSPLFITHTVQM